MSSRPNITRMIVAAVVTVMLGVGTAAQSSGLFTGSTTSGMAPGAPIGSYPLSGFEQINLFNGHLNFALPLLNVGGRGSAGHTITLTMDRSWWVYRYDLGPGFTWRILSIPQAGWWTVKPKYEPGLMVGKKGGYDRSYTADFTYHPDCTTLTRLTFTMPDGTEHEFRDQATNGQPIAQTANPPAPTPNRGKIFVTRDGTSMTFISDSDISDAYCNQLASAQNFNPYGYMLLNDGTRYRVEDGLVKWIRDRNGNQVVYTYTNRRVTTITDSLNRQVNISYATPSDPNDVISYSGFGGGARTVRVSYANLGSALHTNYSVRTHKQLFPELNGASDQPFDPSVVTSVWLPDNRRYQFFYNSYGEVAKVVMPTGGGYEYVHTQGSGVLNDGNTNLVYRGYQIYRRLLERRVWSDASTLEGKTVYEVSENTGEYSALRTTVNERQYNAAGTQLVRSEHLFYGSSASSLFRPRDGNSYNYWTEGKEYETRMYDPTNSTPLSKTARVWAQGGVLSTTPGSTMLARPEDSQLVESTTTTTDTNQVSKSTYAYDQFNNLTDTYEYDFGPVGAGAPGGLLRRTHTGYQNASGYTDAINGVHIRNLPLTQWVSSDAAGNNKVSLTTYGYDQFTLADCPGVVGHDAGYHTGLTARGNPTSVTRYADAAGGTGAVTASSRYDIVGNVVSTTDANNNTSYTGYSDSFSDGVNWRNTYALPTSTASAIPDPNNTGFGSTTPLTGSTVYDYSTGKPTSTTDANGKTTYFDYTDPLDRVKQVTRPDGGVTSYTYDRSLNAGVMSDYVRAASTLDATRWIESYQFFDGLGRATRSFLNEGGSPAVFLTRDTQYDALGRVSGVSNPYRTAGSNDGTAATKWTTNAYDALSRITSVTSADGAAVTTSYTGTTVTVTDQHAAGVPGRSRKTVTDALGRITDVYEDPAGVNYRTAYTYDAAGNLRRVDQGGQLRFYMYNSLSRLIRSKNPEQAAGAAVSNVTDPLTGNAQWSMAYGYDNNGNLTARVDARGVTINYGYDKLNRSTTIRYDDAVLGAGNHTKDVDRHYDGAVNGRGRFYYSNWDANDNTRFDTHLAVDEYDEMGRPKKYRQHFLTNGAASPQFTVTRSYDKLGNVLSQTYPSGHTVNYSYDAAGRVAGFSGNLGDGVSRTYSTGIGYSEFGGIQQEQFGTQTPLYHKLRFNPRGQLYNVRLSTGADAESWNRGMLVNHFGSNDWNVGWGSGGPDNNGNVQRTHHYVPNTDAADLNNPSTYTVFFQDYEYDALNRLKKVTESNSITWTAQYVQAYDYDRWGNRTINANLTWGVPEPQFELAPPSNREVPEPSNRLYAPGDAGRAPASKLMRYDAAGNLVFDAYAGAGARSYDSENRITSAVDRNGVTAYYSYDADGRRVKRKIANEETWDVYGPGGELLAEYRAGSAPFLSAKEYGYRGGKLLVAMASGDVQRLQRFIKSLFYNSLARDPSAAELQQRIDSLSAAGAAGGEAQLLTTARSMARALFESSEYVSRGRTNAQYVSDLYNAYLQRAPDDGGLNFWVQNTQNNGRGATLNAFEVSIEFETMAATLYGRAGAGDDQRVESFVRTLYYGARRQAPSAADMQSKTQRLNNAAAQGQAQAVAEARAIGGEVFVETNYNATRTTAEYVTDLYEAFLQRSPDSLGLNFWVQNTQNNGRAATLAAFQQSIEYSELAATLYREIFWLVSDHLGTPRMVVYKSGSLAGVRRHDFLPFGEELFVNAGGRGTQHGFGVSDNIRHKFTGQQRDDETGLDFLSARYYSSVMGRFTSTDTMGGRVINPQTQNLYEYARNNPLKWIDPTGLLAQIPEDAGKKPVVVVPLVTPLPEGAVSVTIGEFTVVAPTKKGPPKDLPASWHDVVPVWNGVRRLLYYNHTGQPERALGAFYVASLEGAGFVYGLLGRGGVAAVQITERAVVKEVVAESGATAAEAGQSVYRGVHAGHPAMDAARAGKVVPGKPAGTVTAEAHNAGGVAAESQFTSWTHDINVAVRHANKSGPGGVVLELPVGAPPPGATWRWVWSPDVWMEKEVLLQGVREGAKVLKP